MDSEEKGRWKYYPFGMLAEGGASTGSRMKFTGHERDHGGTELDYMRARYCSSGLGVFLSVDPLRASARPVFPSSWNRYEYVLNSPVALVDPSGMYVVSCTEQGGACEAMSKAFEAARQADLRRGGKIEAVAAAYGEPGVDDGVTIKFGKLKEGGVGGEFVGSIDFSKSAGAFVLTATVTIDMRFKSTHLEANIGHEGSHLLDAQTYLKVFGSWDMETISNSSPTTEQSERRAYWISHKILDAGNEIGMFPTATIDVKLGEGVSVRDVDAIISRILTGEDYAKKLQTPLIGGYKLP